MNLTKAFYMAEQEWQVRIAYRNCQCSKYEQFAHFIWKRFSRLALLVWTLNMKECLVQVKASFDRKNDNLR